VPPGSGVHLLLEHSLVDRADGVLRAAEHLRLHSLGLTERELGHCPADPALDLLRAERDLVLAVAFAPLLRPVCVAHGHANDGDRRVHAAERNDPGDPASGAHDHLAADLLAEDPVGGADVAGLFRRDRRRLEPVPVLPNRGRSLVHHGVLRLATVRQREVVARELELDARHVGREHPQGLLEQLLPGLVTLQHDDRVHVAGSYASA
jgi:hypothetical protein